MFQKIRLFSLSSPPTQPKGNNWQWVLQECRGELLVGSIPGEDRLQSWAEGTE